MLDTTFLVNRILKDINLLEDIVRYYGRGNNDKILDMIDDAHTEIVKVKSLIGEKDGLEDTSGNEIV